MSVFLERNFSLGVPFPPFQRKQHQPAKGGVTPSGSSSTCFEFTMRLRDDDWYLDLIQRYRESIKGGKWMSTRNPQP